MIEDLIKDTKICANYESSRTQRAAELARGESLEGTSGYEKAGCYKCNGKNTSCRMYFVLKGYNEQ